MQLIKVGTAVVNQTPLDWDRNVHNLRAVLAEARERGVGVLCLPEMCIPGYGCEDMFQSPDLQRQAMDILIDELMPETRGMVACFGLPVMYQNGLFSCVATVCDGELVGFVAKQNLAGDGLHYEPRWFRGWTHKVRGTVDVRGQRVPIGDLHFECGGIRLGYEICEDAWVAKRPGGDLAQKGVDIIMNPSASHFAFGKLGVRKGFVTEGSRAFGVTYLYANLLGNEAGRAIYDGGALIASAGELLCVGPRLGFHPHHLSTAVVDVSHTRLIQSRTGSFRPELDGDESDCIRHPFVWPAAELEAPSCRDEVAWEQSPDLKMEELTRAMALGLRDYRQKASARGYVVSLSGGADSAACALLVYLADRLAGPVDPAAMAQALTCVYQPTENSSDTTLNAARDVAEALGATFYIFDVDPLVKGYTGAVERALGRTLSWARDDLALQNIQARVRGPSVWMLANLTGQILIATSNRSEAAVGYATMDGDTCGGLSPIAGIDKATIIAWLRWMERTGPAGIGPFPALAAVNAQRPTAELRPQDQDQTDEADLMPYPVLEAIEEAAVGDKKGPLNAWRLACHRFPEVPRTQMGAWVQRFFELWCRNQWKRERYAPSFHVDDKNLDPKTWCRFPILSGGYRRELRALQEALAAESGPITTGAGDPNSTPSAEDP